MLTRQFLLLLASNILQKSNIVAMTRVILAKLKQFQLTTRFYLLYYQNTKTVYVLRLKCTLSVSLWKLLKNVILRHKYQKNCVLNY